MKRDDGKMHNMIRTGAGEGTEEWYCPNCGRRLLLNWVPQFEKVVLEAGDQYAIHTGDLDNAPTTPADTMPSDDIAFQDQVDLSMEDARLLPWMKWLDEVDFENLWNRDI